MEGISISEQAMLNVIYSVKTCMVIMYTRMTLGLVTQNTVRYLGWYMFLGWAATEVAFFAACRPFKGYWAMPPPDPQCATLQRYAMVRACFNTSSDLLMPWVPIPLVLKISAPWRQKVMLLSILSLASFVVIAALLTNAFNLSNVWDPQYVHWYVREASVAINVSNIPAVWPLLRDWVPCLRYLYAVGSISSSGGSRRSGQQQHHSRDHGRRRRRRGRGARGAGEPTLSRRRRFVGIFSSLGDGGLDTITGYRVARTSSRRTAHAGFRSWPGTSSHSVMEHDLEMGMGLKDCGGGGCSSMERVPVLPPPPPSPRGVRALDTKERSQAEAAAAGFCAIHVKRTIKITAEDRDRNASVAALDSQRGGAFIYNWEQSGVSKHCVVVCGGKSERFFFSFVGVCFF